MDRKLCSCTYTPAHNALLFFIYKMCWWDFSLFDPLGFNPFDHIQNNWNELDWTDNSSSLLCSIYSRFSDFLAFSTSLFLKSVTIKYHVLLAHKLPQEAFYLWTKPCNAHCSCLLWIHRKVVREMRLTWSLPRHHSPSQRSLCRVAWLGFSGHLAAIFSYTDFDQQPEGTRPCLTL